MLRSALFSLAALVASVPATAKQTATDWGRVNWASSSGGFVMGNPAARVKLLEYGSLTCSHCAHFDSEGVPSLIADYVRGGQVSWEFRSFLLNSVDIPATLAASCAGPSRFFPVLRKFYATQREWIARLEAVPAARLAEIRAMEQPQQFGAIGDAAGLPAIAAGHGVPAAKVRACLLDDAQAMRAVKVTAFAADNLKVTGTPTIFVNGVKVEHSPGQTMWAVVKSRLDATLNR